MMESRGDVFQRRSEIRVTWLRGLMERNSTCVCVRLFVRTKKFRRKMELNFWDALVLKDSVGILGLDIHNFLHSILAADGRGSPKARQGRRSFLLLS